MPRRPKIIPGSPPGWPLFQLDNSSSSWWDSRLTSMVVTASSLSPPPHVRLIISSTCRLLPRRHHRGQFAACLSWSVADLPSSGQGFKVSKILLNYICLSIAPNNLIFFPIFRQDSCHPIESHMSSSRNFAPCSEIRKQKKRQDRLTKSLKGAMDIETIVICLLYFINLLVWDWLMAMSFF